MAGNLADQLRSVKLRKSATPINDQSGPKLSGFTTPEEIRQYEDSVLEVNTENWMELLRDVTFPTVTCPFSIDEAKLLLNIYKRCFLDKPVDESKSCQWRHQLSKEEEVRIQEIENTLESNMKVYTNEGFAFVKLSSRSPKDAPLLQTKVKDIYLEKLNRFQKDEQIQENTKLICLLEAAFEMMKVKTAVEVLDMLVRSERVYQDLLLAVINRPEVYNTNFIIRKFVHIDVDMEFRGFVKDSRLNALSQYNYLVYSSTLHKQKDAIQKKLLDFFRDTVSPLLSSADFPKDYIIDFAVCKFDEKLPDGFRVWVIEINPFLVTTDGALFSWEREYDTITGKYGFHFRIVTQPKPGSIKMLPSSVRDLFKTIDKCN